MVTHRSRLGCGVTLGSAPFSSTSSGAPVAPAQGSPSSRHRQQKRDWRMLRLRGFLAVVWVPVGGHKGVRGNPGVLPAQNWGPGEPCLGVAPCPYQSRTPIRSAFLPCQPTVPGQHR